MPLTSLETLHRNSTLNIGRGEFYSPWFPPAPYDLREITLETLEALGLLPEYGDYEAFSALLERYDIHYYARPREQFFVHNGINEAFEARAKFILFEDMS